MPLSLAALTADTTHARLAIAGEALNVEWYPKRFTTAMMRKLAAIDPEVRPLTGDVEDMVGRMEFAADMLAQLVKSWDFYEYVNDDGTPGPVIAPTRERLSECSFELLWMILEALLSETRLGESSGTTPKARSHASSSTATRAGSRR